MYFYSMCMCSKATNGGVLRNRCWREVLALEYRGILGESQKWPSCQNEWGVLSRNSIVFLGKLFLLAKWGVLRRNYVVLPGKLKCFKKLTIKKLLWKRDVLTDIIFSAREIRCFNRAVQENNIFSLQVHKKFISWQMSCLWVQLVIPVFSNNNLCYNNWWKFNIRLIISHDITYKIYSQGENNLKFYFTSWNNCKYSRCSSSTILDISYCKTF